LVAAVSAEAGIERHHIHAIAAAGNTVMTHFFLGLDVSSIPVDPFVPVVRTPGFFTASELSLDINPEAAVYVFPNAGSYVGGDIAAGILASGMHGSDDVSILIDVGTNAEVVIGNRDWMIVGAGAAGPALEEGISRIGRRAKRGIVYDFEIRGRSVSCKTFDEGKPEGICGSGMISLLYELYKAGMVDKSGALVPGEYVSETEGERTLTISCEDGRDALSITQAEIHNFMKSKAAMFTLLLTLTRSVGISFGDVAQVYVSGALGTGIDPAKAAGIGMLPAWPRGIVKPLGNSSLSGARMLLSDEDLVGAVNDVIGKITYKHMHDDPEFMKEFLGAVFIPHTNPDLLKVG
ncbi:MAG TPA: ASKHA domain-containing protein, partial [Nitrospirota bacterium]